jgi:hypothetical protein
MFAFAQGTEPKPKAEDYDLHVAAGEVTLGAEYMVRSFTNGRQTFLIDDYLVVEIALYPPKGTPAASRASDFSLRVNGKRPIASAPPSMAAASLRRVQWKQQGPHAEGSVGVGGVDVGVGQPTQRYPDGQPVPTRRPPRAPDDAPGGIEREPPVKADELIVETALPEGEFKGPVSGFVYFPFPGKTSSVKTVELLFRDNALRLK